MDPSRERKELLNLNELIVDQLENLIIQLATLMILVALIPNPETECRLQIRACQIIHIHCLALIFCFLSRIQFYFYQDHFPILSLEYKVIVFIDFYYR